MVLANFSYRELWENQHFPVREIPVQGFWENQHFPVREIPVQGTLGKSAFPCTGNPGTEDSGKISISLYGKSRYRGLWENQHFPVREIPVQGPESWPTLTFSPTVGLANFQPASKKKSALDQSYGGGVYCTNILSSLNYPSGELHMSPSHLEI